MPTIDQEVIQFVADFTGVGRDKINWDTTLSGDLGVDGADGWELVEEFGTRFGVDTTNFNPDRHFGPEGLPILAPFILIGWLVRRPFIKRKTATLEDDAGLTPIRVRDLILMAKERKWIL